MPAHDATVRGRCCRAIGSTKVVASLSLRAFDAEQYKRRNVVERAFNRLKQWRAIATRYDKHARNYRAGVVVGASVLFWLR